jgi:hypothetical protein
MQRYVDEKSGKMALSRAAVEQLDISREQAVQALSSVLGYKPNDQELDALIQGQTDNLKFLNADIQRPRAALNVLRRTAAVREQIARNPMIGPELLTLYKTSMGRGAQQDLATVETQVEDRRASFMKTVDDTSMSLGIDPRLPFEQRSALVMKHFQDVERASAFLRDKQVLDAQVDQDKDSTLTNLRNIVGGRWEYVDGVMRNVVPGVMGMFNQARTQILNELGVTDISRMTPEQQQQATEKLDQWWVNTNLGIRGIGNHPDITQADYDTMIAPLKIMYDSTRLAFSTKGNADTLKAGEEQANALATMELFSRNPELRQTRAVLQVLKDAPNTMAEAAGSTEYGRRLIGTLRVAASASLSQAEAQAGMAQVVRDPTKADGYVRENTQGFRDMAVNPNITDAEFSKALDNFFGAYDPSNQDLARLYHNQLPIMADPAVRERLTRADPAVRAHLTDAMDTYLSTVIQQANGIVRDSLGPRIPALASFENVLQDSMNINYTQDGLPVFRPMPDQAGNSRAIAVAEKLNAIAPRIKQAIDVYQSLGLYTNFDRAEMAKVMIEQGRTPDYLEAQMRQRQDSLGVNTLDLNRITF